MMHRKIERGAESGSRGFTLIELLVVIAVIGILAAIAVPALTSARDRGESAATEAEVASYGNAAAVVLAASGSYPVPDDQDVDNPANPSCDGRATNGAPQLCCVADTPCTYAGRTLAPLSRGAFAPGADGSLFGGSLPRLPRLPAKPIAAGASPLQYRGVFHSCDTAACQNPTVTWTQSSACPTGTTRNGVTGLCSRPIDRSSVRVVPQGEDYCYDGLDDDGDTLFDCADPDCAGRSLCGNEANPSSRCGDGFDNDGDGGEDCDDTQCEGVGTCVQMTESICADGIDNDGDNQTDCADVDCALAPACRPNCIPDGQNESDCSLISGDEDCDGLLNCADSDCSHLAFCGGSELGMCTDSVDNDGDGSYDCGLTGDSDCANDPECGG